MAKASSKAVSDDQLEELESIGKGLQKRTPTPAKKSSKPDKKKVSKDTLREAYLKYLKNEPGYESQSKVQKTTGASKGTVYRAFKEFSEDPTIKTIDAITTKGETPTIEARTLEEHGFDPKRYRVKFYLPADLDNSAYQPRIDAEVPEDLVADIRVYGGNHTPVLVQENVAGKDKVVAGHLRVAAITMINEKKPLEKKLEVFCVIIAEDDTQAAVRALMDNLLHKPLRNRERDRWIAKLVEDFGVSQKEIAKRFKDKLSSEAISNIVRSFRDASPGVRELLDEGTFQVGHAKSVVSLDEVDQERIARAVQKKVEQAEKKGILYAPSVVEVDKKARDKREMRECREIITKHFKTGPKVIDFEGGMSSFVHQTIANLFPGWKHGRWTPRAHDVQAGLKESGVTLNLIEPTAEENHKKMQEVADRACADKPIPEPSACIKCLGHAASAKGCSLILGQEKMKEPRMECDEQLLKKDRVWINPQYVHRCPFCNGLTLFQMPGVSYHRVGPEDQWDTFSFQDLGQDYMAHGQCIIDELIKLKQLLGVECKDCQNMECRVLEILDELYGRRLKVLECGGEKVARVDIKKVNKWADEQYAQAIAEQKAALAKEEGGTA